MEPLIIVLAVLAALGIGGGIGFYFRDSILGGKMRNAVGRRWRRLRRSGRGLSWRPKRRP